MGPDATLEVDAEVGLVDGETAEVATAEIDLKTEAGSVVAQSTTEAVSGCVDLHIVADSVAHPEETNDARIKNVRKADSMGTITAEPLAVPEKKMRADDTLLVGSEAEEKKHAQRLSNEARAKRNAKSTQRQRARKASISGRQNITETDGAQEAEDTDGEGKSENSTEHLHGLI